MKYFGKLMLAAMATAICVSTASAKEPERNGLRAPAYPLVTIDPYTSAWSPADKLYDDTVIHWTGKDFPLIGAVKVDGKIYRFMGVENVSVEPLAPMASVKAWEGRYVFEEPSGDWSSLGYDDSSWKKGQGAFGTHDYPVAKTEWNSEYIWVRRTVDLTVEQLRKKLYLNYSSDDFADIYVNGVLAKHAARSMQNAVVPLSDEASANLRPGKNIIAAKCHNTGGWGLIDFGLMTQDPDAPAKLERTAIQNYADVEATNTYYDFTCGPVDLKITFTAPLLMDNLLVMSRPVNYITYEVESLDSRKHDVTVYLEASPLWAADTPDQATTSETFVRHSITYLKAGTKSQNILGKSGDGVRIDWGYFYLAGSYDGTYAGVGSGPALRKAFAEGKNIENVGKKGDNDNGRMAILRPLGKVKEASGMFMIGYDDIYSIQYFGTNLRPYWNNNGNRTIQEAFEDAKAEYPQLMEKCKAFDEQLMADATKAGGRKYAELCALAYRQSIAAHKLVMSPDGELHWMSKENNSNGSIGTVDVTYPSAPLFLLYNPHLAEGLLNHIFYYSESGKWTKPFPAHDVGTYPLANGQTYGGDMPVEEAGNMIILTAAICHFEDSPEYAKKHWETLTTWVEYLSKFGLDPDNQLCTDDFAGHFAHNVNLSAKAIMAIASYGYMAGLLGMDDVKKAYSNKAKDMTSKWLNMADDGDHYKLTFDKSGTWSQKYNIVWDRVLGLGIFPPFVTNKELEYYGTVQNVYGLPLDSRKTYTKTDWIMWTASMAQTQEQFESFIDPVWKYMNETVDRVPMSDWVYTDKPVRAGFKARSVVGGYFIKMLENKQ